MMTNLPKLDFLYFNLEHTEENYLNKRNLYYNKVDWDERHFEDYVKVCSFEELIFLMIYIYKDKYPRSIFDSAISLDYEKQNLLSHTNKKGRGISENKYIFNNFLRKDVTGMISQFHSEEYTEDEIIEKYWRGESYMQNLFLEFNKEVPIHIIDKALEGKEYTKTEKDGVLLYEVKDSPIASLEVTKNSIKLNINEEKVILYVMIW
ncbi:hypothetical protein [Flavobacterium aquidurense]|jgi:hypothetical protein|uniref:hypothetical protein n=1 Tax=Flavobacterium aquidurense TaxID=362413 RepID=UPI0009334194|nr:hypothetical protein [Flavobacterium aquidurense]